MKNNQQIEFKIPQTKNENKVELIYDLNNTEILPVKKKFFQDGNSCFNKITEKYEEFDD